MDEKELVASMPSETATDPEVPSQEPVARTGDDE